MQINVNGKSRNIAAGLTIAGLLEELNLDPRRVAVEHNRNIALRDEFNRITLTEGDTLEIVQFVGGG